MERDNNNGGLGKGSTSIQVCTIYKDYDFFWNLLKKIQGILTSIYDEIWKKETEWEHASYIYCLHFYYHANKPIISSLIIRPTKICIYNVHNI